MRQQRWSSLVFLAGVMLVFSALGWVTWHALRLERGELEARAEARYQENIRLALWRMDSMVAPILAREAARPYFEYQSFYPADKAYTRLLNRVEPGEVLVPSPLLQPASPYVKLHFETSAEGTVSSPQVPTGPMRPLAESVYVSGYSLALAEQTLSQLIPLLFPPVRVKGSDRGLAADVGGAGLRFDTTSDDAHLPPASAAPMQAQKAAGPEVASSANEYQSRVRNLDQAQQMTGGQRQLALGPPAATPAPGHSPVRDSTLPWRADSAPSARTSFGPGSEKKKDDPFARAGAGADALDLDSAQPVLIDASDAGVVQREFVPRWLPAGRDGVELVYVRQVTASHTTFAQGFWVDWAALSANLLQGVHDLLPDATLRPLQAVPASDDLAVLGRSLASVPAELVAPIPHVEAVPLTVLTPVRTTLLVTWIAALGAVLAIALVLRASLELAERRGRFVSAVTHELRTPLTTFCLYSQMLADGMVPTDEARQSYARTLNTESQRLARIVESVLDYARLGRAKRSGGKIVIDAESLLGKVVPPLLARCEQGGMQFVSESSDVGGALVRCDPSQIERILYNLVDNACKYASGSEDKRVHFSVARTKTHLTFSVRDHGPGIDSQEKRRVFRPFMRGQRQDDGSIPGLGLGLSLASGLAKECRGELKLVPGGCGAEFQLIIPIAQPSA